MTMKLPFLLVCVLYLSVGTYQKPATKTEDPRDCVKEFLELCSNDLYSPNETVVFSENSFDNGRRKSINCRVNQNGTRCVLNGSPWYHCFPNKTLQYKGEWLNENSAGDSTICAAKDQAKKFKSQFNTTALENKLSKEMQHLQQQIKKMKNAFSWSFPFDSWFDSESSSENSSENLSDQDDSDYDFFSF